MANDHTAELVSSPPQREVSDVTSFRRPARSLLDPRSCRTAAILLASVTALATVAAGQTAQRDWYQYYSDGVRAIQSGAWQQAASSLEAAKKGGPAPGKNVRTYGDNAVDFNPDFYLGVAYYSLKRFREADAAFTRAAAEKLLDKGTPQYDQFQRLAPAARYEVLLADAQDLRTRRQFDAALAKVTEAGALSNDSRVAALRDQIQKDRDAANANTPSQTQNAGPPPQNPPPENPQTQTSRQQQPPVRPIDIGASNAPSLNPVGVGATSSRPSRRAAPTGSRAVVASRQNQPPPPALVTEQDALTLFFSGRYQEASDALERLTMARGASSRAFFYYACSQAAVELINPGAPPQSKGSPKEILKLAGDSRQFSSELRYISPRILQILGLQP
jgi:hypothetical protein